MSETDDREPAQRDRDRILYTSAFRRLAGITQVTAGELGLSVHNRLTHALEVAQVGRRLTERLLRNDEQRQIAEQIGGVSPDVVEAACLAHDLGHPPFGHIAEEVLDDLATHEHQLGDGFEGNAQSFRVVTKLAVRREEHLGLDLTRATLNALLKYPTMRQPNGKYHHKRSAYTDEQEDFDFARKLDATPMRKSAEAELMDWSDDVAYSVHDMEDYYRAGRIPLDRLVRDEGERRRFLDNLHKVWDELGYHTNPDERKSFTDAFDLLWDFIAIEQPYNGSMEQRSDIRAVTSLLIGRYMQGIKLRVPTDSNPRFVEINADLERELAMLKELTWQYVIRDPSLATQQHGQRHIISELFRIYLDACGDKRSWHLLPLASREQAEKARCDQKNNELLRVRIVLDLIAGLGEQQAVEIYRRLTGISDGSALAGFVR